DPRKRWRCMYVDEVDQVLAADHASPWQSAENYNSARPFPVIEEVAVAVTVTVERPLVRRRPAGG
ncbi:MAG: hypothetical protein ACRD0L_01420, partial [Acidimicrobiales bacterium]